MKDNTKYVIVVNGQGNSSFVLEVTAILREWNGVKVLHDGRADRWSFYPWTVVQSVERVA